MFSLLRYIAGCIPNKEYEGLCTIYGGNVGVRSFFEKTWQTVLTLNAEDTFIFRNKVLFL